MRVDLLKIYNLKLLIFIIAIILFYRARMNLHLHRIKLCTKMLAHREVYDKN